MSRPQDPTPDAQWFDSARNSNWRWDGYEWVPFVSSEPVETWKDKLFNLPLWISDRMNAPMLLMLGVLIGGSIGAIMGWMIFQEIDGAFVPILALELLAIFGMIKIWMLFYHWSIVKYWRDGYE